MLRTSVLMFFATRRYAQRVSCTQAQPRYASDVSSPAHTALNVTAA